jgi:hypothetical protein
VRNPRISGGRTLYLTSGEPAQMQARIRELLGVDADVEGLTWKDGELVARNA